MYLVIETLDKNYEEDFYPWLISKMQQYVVGAIDNKKLILLNDYINNIPKYKSLFKKTLNSRDALISCFYNLKIIKLWDKVIISPDINLLIPNSKIKNITIVKLITYGTLNIRGYPLLLEIFDYFKKHLDVLYNMYERGL